MIYLYGHGGSMNHGCEALVRSTVQMFRWPSVLFSANREQDEAYELQDLLPVYQDIGKNLTKPSLYYYLSAVEMKTKGTTVLHSRYAHANLLSAVKKGDICLSIGGDNYCYAGIEKIADLNYLLHKKGARTVLWGCSIEPEVLTPAVVKDLNRYDLITVRESRTFHALERAGVRAKRILCADPAFQLECIEKPWPSDWPKGDFIGINVSPLILSYEQQQGITLQNYTNLIRTILTEKDCAVLLLSLLHIYSILMAKAVNLNKTQQKEKLLSEIQKMQDILRYDIHPKIKNVNRVKKIFGYRVTLMVLGMYLKYRGR